VSQATIVLISETPSMLNESSTLFALLLPAKQASTVPAKPTGQGGNWAGKKQVRINA
jgi:hypothetical protein